MYDYTDGEPLHANAFLSSTDAVLGTGVVAGVGSELEVTDGGTNDMDISIGSGDAVVGGTGVSKGTSTTKTLNAADSTDPRYDTVEMDSTGTISVKTGNAASNPAAPLRTAGSIVLAVIRVGAGVSGVTNSDIYDQRSVSSVELAQLGFDPATQTELDNHAGTAGAHHARPGAGNALAEDTNGNFNVQEGNVDHGNLAGVTSSDHHTRPSAGTGLTEDTNNNFNSEDGWRLESRDNLSSVSSHSVTLSTTYKEVRCRFDITGTATNNPRRLRMQVNGDTGTNYNFYQQNGTYSSGNSSVWMGRVGPGASSSVIWRMAGDWQGVFSGRVEHAAIKNDTADWFENEAVTTPLDTISFNIPSSETVSGTFEVFGR